MTDAPPQAAAVGYNTNTFSSVVFDSTTVNLTPQNNSGYQWYLWQFFGQSAKASAVKLSNDSVLLTGDRTGPNGQIATIAPTGGGNFVGTAFGGGGYFEATIKFGSSFNSSGWPSFWSMASEHLVGYQTGQDVWPGQANNYRHFVELDFFEFDTGNPTFGSTIHEWYGPDGAFSQATIPWPDFVRTPPVGTDYAKYHKYGCLWVPASATTQGSLTFYFDGVQIGAGVTWSAGSGSPPPVGPWQYAILDAQHLVPILGTGPKAPMSVSSVSIWQRDASGNLTF